MSAKEIADIKEDVQLINTLTRGHPSRRAIATCLDDILAALRSRLPASKEKPNE